MNPSTRSMMTTHSKDFPVKSKRGVYYDLTQSPYEFQTSTGVVFKFSSAKKLEIYERKLKERLQWVEKYVNKINDVVGDHYTITPQVISYIENDLYNEVEK